MQAIRASRFLSQLSRETSAAVQAASGSTRRNVVQSALQHQVSPVSTSTPSHGLGRAARQLTTGKKNTQPHPSLRQIFWRASESARLDNMRCHGPRCDGGNNRSSSTATGAAARPRRVSLTRGSRETEATPAAAGGVARRSMSSSTMSEREFHVVADEALEDIHDAVEEALEDGFAEEFDCNMSQGVLNIVVGDRGTWVLNKQSPNRQIWWSSPISGPMRFEFHDDSKRWLNTRDGQTELRDLLAKEMDEKCGVSLF